MIHYEDDTLTLIQGDALEQACTLGTASVRTIVTSPPYFGLRDYGMEGQYGAETDVEGYVSHMVTLFRELRRVLTDDGTLWLNIGDSYGTPSAGRNDGDHRADGRAGGMSYKAVGTKQLVGKGAAPKNLAGVPWRTAIALQDDGWILRSDIIWAKPNPMPESVTDRPTKAHEYLFMFAKSPRYYYNADAIAEKVAASSIARVSQDVESQAGSARANGGAKTNGNLKAVGGMDFRNKRSVWTVPTLPFAEAHFAVYPPDLIRPCILAGSEPGDTVLDPFSGSGTTGMVATQEGRKYIGIDLNADYLDLSLRTRFVQPTLGVG